MAKTYVPLATQTLGSAAASVTFSGISGAYTDLVLVVANFTAANNSANLWATVNGDSGSNYSSTLLGGYVSGAFSTRTSSTAKIFLGAWNTGIQSSSSYPAMATVNFMNYSNATTYKTVLARVGFMTSTSSETDVSVSLWRSTAAITSITVNPDSGNINTGAVFSLYGIASA